MQMAKIGARPCGSRRAAPLPPRQYVCLGDARQMQVKRKKRRSRGHPVLAGFLAILILGGVAYGGATLWQKAENASLPETSQKQEVSSAGGSAPGDSSGNLSMQSLSAQPGEEELSEADEISREEDPGDGSQPSDPAESSGESSAPEALPVSFQPTAYTVEWQVSPTDPVEDAYFDDALFLGDSVSTGITVYHIADNAACIAAIGVSPGTAVDSQCIVTPNGKLTMLEAAKAKGERSKVYIMLGGNGLWLDKDSFIKGYQEFIDAVKEQYPAATVYIQSMTPVTTFVGQTYPTVSNEKVIEYNAAIAQLAKDNDLPFVNVFEGLAGPDGYLPASSSSDGLHLSPEYYYKWFDYLKAHTVEG